jgi:hypothetical protein
VSRLRGLVQPGQNAEEKEARSIAQLASPGPAREAGRTWTVSTGPAANDDMWGASVVEPIRSLTISVTGAVEAALPPTWGQRSIWQWHGMVDQAEAYFANGKCFDLADYARGGCGFDALAGAIGEVLHRHDALRTVLEIENGAVARQVVSGSGELSVDVYDAGSEKTYVVAEAVASRLSGLPWNGREWPVRMAVVAAGETPAQVVIAHNRLVLDVQSLDFLMDDVGKVASGRAGELVPRWQTVQEARYEQSPEGAAVSDRAAQYWRRVLSAAPPSMFDFPVGSSDDTRFVMAQMESVPLARAVQVLRKRWRVTGGALVLAAMAVVLGQYTGHRAIVVQMFAGNRSDRHRRRMLGTVISEGLVHLDLHGLSFAQIAREASRASSMAHQFGFCDPAAVRAVREEMQLVKGAHLDLAFYFNDMQTGQEPSDDQPEPTEQELAELAQAARGAEAGGSALTAPETWSGWDQSWQAKVTRKDIRLLLTAQHGRELPLLLFCDTRYVPRQAMRELLSGMQRLLLAAAGGGDVVAADLGRVSGVAAVSRGPSWARCGDGWLDVAAAEELWQKVTGSDQGTVLAEEVPGDGGEHRLVGYAVGATPPSFTDLHRLFVAAIGERNDVRAPNWYRWVAAEPADPQDAAAWGRAPVLAEGDGRP